jgi:hypothetical protein
MLAPLDVQQPNNLAEFQREFESIVKCLVGGDGYFEA